MIIFLTFVRSLTEDRTHLIFSLGEILFHGYRLVEAKRWSQWFHVSSPFLDSAPDIMGNLEVPGAISDPCPGKLASSGSHGHLWVSRLWLLRGLQILEIASAHSFFALLNVILVNIPSGTTRHSGIIGVIRRLALFSHYAHQRLAVARPRCFYGKIRPATQTHASPVI